MKQLLLILTVIQLTVSSLFAGDDITNFQLNSCAYFPSVSGVDPNNLEKGYVTFSFDLVTMYKIDYGFPLTWQYHYKHPLQSGTESSQNISDWRHRFWGQFVIKENTPDYIYVDAEVDYNRNNSLGMTVKKDERGGHNFYIGHIRNRYWRILSTNVTNSNSDVFVAAGRSVTLKPGFSYTASSNLEFRAHIEKQSCSQQNREANFDFSIEQENDAAQALDRLALPYPNPSSGIVHVDLDESISSYAVYNSVGASINIGLNETGEMDFTNFDDGIYILSLVRDSGTENLKIVIEH